MGMQGSSGGQQKAAQPQPMGYAGSQTAGSTYPNYSNWGPPQQGAVQTMPYAMGKVGYAGPMGGNMTNGPAMQGQVMPANWQALPQYSNQNALAGGNMLGSGVEQAKQADQGTNAQSVTAPTVDTSQSPSTPNASPSTPGQQPPPIHNWQGWATGGRMGPQEQSPYGTGRMLGPAQLTQTGGPNQLNTGYPTNQNNPNGAGGKKAGQPPPMGAGGAGGGTGSGGGMGKGAAPPVPNGPGATAGSGANPANKALAGYGAHPDLMNAGLTEAQLMPLVGHLGVNDPFRQQMIQKYGGQEGLNAKINQYGAGGGNDYNPQMNAWAQQYAAAINPALSQQARDFNRSQLAGSPYAALLGG